MKSGSQHELVDVLLPVYNGEATIEKSVLSVLNQSAPPARVLVVDDGSTDSTPEILDRLSRSDTRVTVLRKKNGGIVDALNFGLSHATAPYVARQDADDISFPNRFELQIAAMEHAHDVVAVSGACQHADERGRLTGTRYEGSEPVLASYDTLPSTEPYLLHPFLMARKASLDAVGGYRHVFHAEDTDLYWRLREIGRLQNLREPLGRMTVHTGSISNSSIQNGRIMAVCSQLAAISARRRAEGRGDFDFPRSALTAYQAAPNLRSMLEIARPSLTEEEFLYLRTAAAVKLLELAAGRLYELESEDCRLVRGIYASLSSDELRRQAIANWAYRTTLARLARKMRIAEFMALFDIGTLGRAVAFRILN